MIYKQTKPRTLGSKATLYGLPLVSFGVNTFGNWLGDSVNRKYEKDVRRIKAGRIAKDIPYITATTGEEFADRRLRLSSLYDRELAYRLRPYEQERAEIYAERRSRKSSKRKIYDILFGGFS